MHGIIIFFLIVAVIALGVGLFTAHENPYQWRGPSDKS